MWTNEEEIAIYERLFMSVQAKWNATSESNLPGAPW